jgi:hypothetical protein
MSSREYWNRFLETLPWMCTLGAFFSLFWDPVAGLALALYGLVALGAITLRDRL